MAVESAGNVERINLGVNTANARRVHGEDCGGIIFIVENVINGFVLRGVFNTGLHSRIIRTYY